MEITMYTTIIPAADFLRLATIPAPGTSPAIHCVRIERDDYGVVGVATDGHVLAAIRFEADEATCTAPASIRLNKSLLQACRAKRKEMRYVAVSKDKISVLMTPLFDGEARWRSAVAPGAGLGQVMAFSPADAVVETADYPRWRNIVPQGVASGTRATKLGHVAIDPRLLAKFAAFGDGGVSLDWDGDRVMRVAVNGDTRVAGLIMPRRAGVGADDLIDRAVHVFGATAGNVAAAA
jgi:hypothetical protein